MTSQSRTRKKLQNGYQEAIVTHKDIRLRKDRKRNFNFERKRKDIKDYFFFENDNICLKGVNVCVLVL